VGGVPGVRCMGVDDVTSYARQQKLTKFRSFRPKSPFTADP